MVSRLVCRSTSLTRLLGETSLSSPPRFFAFIAGLHLFQHRSSQLPRVGPVRPPPAVAMLQGLPSPPPIPRPDPLGLPITQLQQLAGFSQPQVARLHSAHQLNPTQLLAAQSRSPQSVYLLSEAL